MRFISIKDGKKSVIEVSNIRQFKRPCLFIGDELCLRKVATFSSEEDSLLFENFLWENFLKQNDQEPILDKIRAEIEQITDTMGVSYNQYVSKIDVLQIIDKYKAESEDKE